jgi:hypothetical protein
MADGLSVNTFNSFNTARNHSEVELKFERRIRLASGPKLGAGSGKSHLHDASHLVAEIGFGAYKGQNGCHGGSSDKALVVPNLYCVTGRRLHCFDNGFLVIGTLDLLATEKAAVKTDDVDAICWHARAPCLRRERYRTLSHQRQS